MAGATGIGWQQAETIALRFMVELGYTDARQTKLSGDGGIDVVSSRAVAQVKYQQRPVPPDAVQKIKGAAYDGRQAVFYSWSGYSRNAIAFAEQADVALFIVVGDSQQPVSPKAKNLLEASATFRAQRRTTEQRRVEEEARRRTAYENEARRQAEAEQAERARLEREAAIEAAIREAECKKRRDRRKRWLTAAPRAVRCAASGVGSYCRRSGARQRRMLADANATTPVIWAWVFSLAGILCPIGLSAGGGWFALDARARLTAAGHMRSPWLLRIPAVLATITTGLVAAVVVSLGFTAFAGDQIDRSDGFSTTTEDVLDGLMVVVILAVGVLGLYAWSKAEQPKGT